MPDTAYTRVCLAGRQVVQVGEASAIHSGPTVRLPTLGDSAFKARQCSGHRCCCAHASFSRPRDDLGVANGSAATPSAARQGGAALLFPPSALRTSAPWSIGPHSEVRSWGCRARLVSAHVARKVAATRVAPRSHSFALYSVTGVWSFCLL